MGGHIERFCALESASFDPAAKEWTLKIQGEIKCEYVVNAAGYRAQVGQMWATAGANGQHEPPVPSDRPCARS